MTLIAITNRRQWSLKVDAVFGRSLEIAACCNNDIGYVERSRFDSAHMWNPQGV
jgi:hypothetical protein